MLLTIMFREVRYTTSLNLKAALLCNLNYFSQIVNYFPSAHGATYIQLVNYLNLCIVSFFIVYSFLFIFICQFHNNSKTGHDTSMAVAAYLSSLGSYF